MLFCIAGMHRSGTSMITRLLHICGMYLGREHDLLPPQPDNPQGFWENRGFVEVNDRLLASLGGSWMDPPDTDKDWVHSAHLEPIRAEAKRLLAPLRVRFFSGWKDPRNSLTLRFWQTMAPELKVVVPLRHPLEVAQSLNRRNGLNLIRGMQLWYIYNMQLYQAMNDSFYVLEYGDVLRDPCGELSGLLQWAQISVSRRRILDAAQTVRTNLRHHDHQKCDKQIPHGMTHVFALYEALKECAEKKAGPTEDWGSIRGRRIPAQGRGGKYPVSLSETTFGDGNMPARDRRSFGKADRGHFRDDGAGQAPGLFYGEKESCAPLCSIVIPVHNQLAYTDKCLRSIARCGSGGPDFEVVVVNNGSTDETRMFLKKVEKRYPFLKIIHLERNGGFAVACNVGARAARGSLLVFLNNDTVVLPGWLDALVEAYRQDDQVGIVGAKLLYPDGTIQHAGIAFRWIESKGLRYPWPVHVWRGAPSTAAEVNRKREVEAVTGACLLISKDLFEKLGGFDQSYYMYFEDIDLNLKVRCLGRKIIYCPESTVIHFEGKSSPDQSEINRLNHRSYQRFYQKWRHELEGGFSSTETSGPLAFPNRPDEGKTGYSTGSKGLRGIRWQSPVWNFNGHASHARKVIAALQQTRIFLSVVPTAPDKLFVRHLTPSEMAMWNELMRKPVGQGAYLCFAVPNLEDGTDAFRAWREANPGFDTYVGITTFETDSLPPGWADACNGMDELWVPSTFNRETFARGGVDPSRIHVFPTSIDTNVYDRRRVVPLSIKNRRGFAFLSVFQWTHRKGWDVLLRAYLSAFEPDEDVCLILRTYPYKIKEPPIRERMETYIRNLGVDPRETPPIILLDKFIPEKFMPSLYATADAYVLPSRGEGFGLPYMEAMAMELPVIATRWGGHLDYMNDDNSYLVDVEGLRPADSQLTAETSYYAGDQKLAEPSVSHTAELMRHVFDNRDEALQRGRAARQHILNHWNMERAVRWFQNRLAWIHS
ncbi:Glycosyltransferase, GT2 family [Desulfacinum hydrothermale DSM 13146]|uniref:Glycosyltransferase, GT2 family n=1 Tax=Desulfacinum hydrothermale DSM 13146 TaxID=1121390 RepID=A0A1W1XES3_9BACT|nr:glycosyltransferase [Desulfacinum hydrothermale]SMC22443.1 Glycosyltransferase, GT2 family [Desulfacinum hydrothermale DSM 13146]